MKVSTICSSLPVCSECGAGDALHVDHKVMSGSKHRATDNSLHW